MSLRAVRSLAFWRRHLRFSAYLGSRLAIHGTPSVHVISPSLSCPTPPKPHCLTCIAHYSSFGIDDTSQVPSSLYPNVTRRATDRLAHELTPHARRLTQTPLRNVFVVQNTEEGLSKAAQLRPDGVIFDVEDSVSLAHKPAARAFIASILTRNIREDDRFSSIVHPPTVFVRLNGWEHREELEHDVASLVLAGVDAFILPKVQTATDILEFERMLAAAEMKRGLKPGGISLVPVLESAGGILNVIPILTASPRVCGCVFGVADLAASMKSLESRRVIDSGRQSVAVAAHAVGVFALCSADVTRVDDKIRFSQSCLEAKDLGYAGKICIIPMQVQVAAVKLAPNGSDVKFARMVLDATKANGKGVIRVHDEAPRKFVDNPHTVIAQAVLARNAAIAARKSPNTVAVKLLTPITAPRGGINWSSLHRGQVFEAEHEVTVQQPWIDMWNSSFIAPSRLNTVGLAEKGIQIGPNYLPFTMLLTLTMSLAISRLSESALVHLGMYNARQLESVRSGDTLRAYVKISEVFQTSKRNVIVDSSHAAVNQHGVAVFTVGKRTLFPPVADLSCTPLQSPSQREYTGFSSHTSAAKPPQVANLFAHDELLAQATALQDTIPLSPGRVIVHNMVKNFGGSEVRGLCTLMKIINSHHFDVVKFESQDILVPGPFVLTSALANCRREVRDALHQTWDFALNLNKVNLHDQLASISFIHDVKTVSKWLEEVTLTTIGVKNANRDVLSELPLPKQLFSAKPLKPAEYEAVCADYCPDLMHNIACVIHRTVIRPIPSTSRPVRSQSVPTSLADAW